MMKKFEYSRPPCFRFYPIPEIGNLETQDPKNNKITLNKKTYNFTMCFFKK